MIFLPTAARKPPQPCIRMLLASNPRTEDGQDATSNNDEDAVGATKNVKELRDQDAQIIKPFQESQKVWHTWCQGMSQLQLHSDYS